MAKTRSQTRSPSPPERNSTSIAASRSPNRKQKRTVTFFTACRHVLDSRKKQDRSGESWTKTARIVPGFCPKCNSEKKISSKKSRGNAHKLSPRAGKKLSYYKLLVQANAKNFGDGDLATAKKTFMFALLKEWFNADGNIMDGDIKYMYTCLEGVTEDTLNGKSGEEEAEQQEVEEGEEDDESDCAMTSEELTEEDDDNKSDSDDDVMAEQFKTFWKEWQEKRAEKGNQGEMEDDESDSSVD